MQLLLANCKPDPTNDHRAIMSLYGNIGSNLDERNWEQILASPDPLLASEKALVAMLSDSAYLLRNANHLLQLGYTDNQISYTYQQMEQRVNSTYNADWAVNTIFSSAASTNVAQLIPLIVLDQRARQPPPTISFTGSESGFLATLSEQGILRLSINGILGSFNQGSTLLVNETNFVKRGYMTLRSNDTDKLSVVSEQYFILGTPNQDIINAGSAGWRASINFIDAGAGEDVVDGWIGADYILAGSGEDLVDGNTGNDTILGGIGSDFLVGGQGDDILNGGTGADFIAGDNGTDTILLASGVAERDVVFMDILAGDAADTIHGFTFGVGPDADSLVLFGMMGLDLVGDPGNDGLSDAITNAIGAVQQNYLADTAALADNGRAALYQIGLGADQLGADTTLANAVARAVVQLADGGLDFLANTTGPNQGALVLMTDNGTRQFLFAVIDVDNNQTTTAVDVSLIGIFVDAVAPQSVVMGNFSN